LQDVIVAVFESATQAENAQRALETEGVPGAAIHRYHQGTSETVDEPGDGLASRVGEFFSWLFSSEQDYTTERTRYDNATKAGRAVLRVDLSDQHDEELMTSILHSFHPIELHDDNSIEPMTGAVEPTLATTASLGHGRASDRTAYDSPSGAGSAAARDITQPSGSHMSGEPDPASPCAVERRAGGKRMTDAGSTRIRRFAVTEPTGHDVVRSDDLDQVERASPSTSFP
jgi:hypothetical protein